MSRTNVIVILADDLGYSDLGCYGGEIRTPVLDRLGYGGVRMSQFYNTARCSPSRASLLTGMHPHQTGIGVLTRPDLPNGYAGNLSDQCITIAERMKAAGWQTWMSGKWHLASDSHQPNSSWPTRRGFDRFFGTLSGSGSFYNPQTLTRGEAPASDPEDNPDFYYTDAISDELVGWIDESATEDEEKPFFAYLAYTAPHWPLHAPEATVASYQGVFDDGWDKLRERRLARLVAEGLVTPGASLSERDPSQSEWSDVTDKEWQLRRMEVYAAQVEAMDSGIGRVVDALDRAGKLDDTLIVFLSDNGASAEELPIGSMETFVLKDEAMRDGTRSGEPLRIGNSPNIVPGAEDTYASYGVPWANLSNAPLRLYKRWVHEGGISAPLIASWPNGGFAKRSVIQTPFQLVDVVPTILAACQTTETAAEVERRDSYTGHSMLGAWRGEAVKAAPLFWEHIGNAAVRMGKWKLVREQLSGWELYDIECDRIEAHNVAEAHPEQVESMSNAWEAWADHVGVISWDDMLTRYAALGIDSSQAEE